MELFNVKDAKNILEKFNTRPSKRLGQNFLIDKNILQKIIDAAEINGSDIILEVGPGLGILTQELAQKAKKIMAVEKDNTMVEILKENLKDFQNIEIVNTDILKFQIKEKYKVVANIPYYLTSPLIRKLLEEDKQPSEIILMVQKEVAQRICATPPNMNLLAVSVQFYANPKILFNVSKNSFWPIPKIDSAVIKITPSHFGGQTQKNSGERVSAELFFKVVKAGFSQPRKQLAGNLSSVLKIPKPEIEKLLLQNNIQPTQRAETLSVQNWKKLAQCFC